MLYGPRLKEKLQRPSGGNDVNKVFLLLVGILFILTVTTPRGRDTWDVAVGRKKASG